MLVDALRRCNFNISQLACCNDRNPCNCEESLQEDYYSRSDTYNCQKKMDTYAIKYGPSYVSEVYHYLNESKVIDDFANSNMNVVSLGCGFAPDYYALQRYNDDNSLNINIKYWGLDISTSWNIARPPVTPNCSFSCQDLTNSFTLQGADIVFVCKSFSTMYRNDIEKKFLSNLETAITNDLKNGAIVVFVDVNHRDFGRDVFDTSISRIMRYPRRYYFEGLEGVQSGAYKEHGWVEIEQNHIIYPLDPTLSVESIPHTNKTVIFEYRK